MLLNIAKQLAKLKFGTWAVFAIEAYQQVNDIIKSGRSSLFAMIRSATNVLYKRFKSKLKNASQQEVELAVTLHYLSAKADYALFTPNDTVQIDEAIRILQELKS